MKLHLWNNCRIGVSSASDRLSCEENLLQPIGSTTQTWVVTFRYRISAVLPQMSFLRENSGGVLKKSLKYIIKKIEN